MTRSHWTPDEEQILVDNYLLMSISETLLLLPDKSPSAIRSKASKLGLRTSYWWTEAEEQILLENYGKLEVKEIAKLLPGRAVASIFVKAQKLNLKVTYEDFRSRYGPDPLFFREPSVLNSYWAGFLAADGCVQPDRPLIHLKLSAQDRDHLRLFARQAGFTKEPRITYADYHTKKSEQSILSAWSPEWVVDLANNFNVRPQKSLTLEPPPALAHELRLAFIVGYLDGDGSISLSGGLVKGKFYSYPSIGFVGTRAMLQWIKQEFDELAASSRSNASDIVSHSTIFRYSMKGKRAQAILSILKAVDCPHLPRKWDKVRPDGSINPT